MLAAKHKFNGNTLWPVTDFPLITQVPIRKLESMRLVNVIGSYGRTTWARYHDIDTGNPDDLLFALMSEAKRRGIQRQFIIAGPYPFVGLKGQLLIYDRGFGYPVRCPDSHPVALSGFQQEQLIRAAGMRSFCFPTNGFVIGEIWDDRLHQLCRYGYLYYPTTKSDLPLRYGSGIYRITEKGKSAAVMIKTIQKLEKRDKRAGR